MVKWPLVWVYIALAGLVIWWLFNTFADGNLIKEVEYARSKTAQGIQVSPLW